jgi:hypothetical protein
VLQQLSAKTTEHLFPGNIFVLMIEGNYVKFSVVLWLQGITETTILHCLYPVMLYDQFLIGNIGLSCLHNKYFNVDQLLVSIL